MTKTHLLVAAGAGLAVYLAWRWWSREAKKTMPVGTVTSPYLAPTSDVLDDVTITLTSRPHEAKPIGTAPEEFEPELTASLSLGSSRLSFTR